MTDKTTEKIRVLVADDEAEFASTLITRLQLRDFEALMANSGMKALEILDGGNIDVLVLDLKMPDLDGLEVLARLRVNYPDLPVIILTGHGAFESGRKGMELGAFDYIMKPVDLGMLITRIKEAHNSVQDEKP